MRYLDAEVATDGDEMKRHIRIWLAGGLFVVALAALLLGGTAFADDSSTGSAMQQTFIDKLAAKLGISSDDLNSKINEASSETVDQALSDGTITQQADALKQQLTNGESLFRFSGGPHGFGRHSFDVDTVATTLGITSDELRTELQSGTALKDVITNHGKTVDEVVNALVAQEKTELDQAVTDGRITQAQEDQMLANLPTQLTDAINNGTLPCVGGHRFNDNDDDQTPSDSSATPDTGV